MSTNDPLKKISPSVITSKSASREFEHIKGQHADLLTGMANQKMRVDAYSQQKQAEMQAQQTMKTQMEQEKQVYETGVRKDALTFAMKQAELDVKKSALMQT